MPYIAVSMYEGRSEELKKEYSAQLIKTTAQTLHIPESAVSISFAEYAKDKWEQEVVVPEIQNKKEKIYAMKDGKIYTLLELENMEENK